MSNIATRIRDLRRARGWSQARLAAETDLSHRTIVRLETEPDPNPSRSTLRLLATALDVPVADLTGVE